MWLSHVLGSGRSSCPRLAWCCFLAFVILLCQWAKHDSILFYPRGFWKWKTTEWPHLNKTALWIRHKDRSSRTRAKTGPFRPHESTRFYSVCISQLAKLQKVLKIECRKSFWSTLANSCLNEKCCQLCVFILCEEGSYSLLSSSKK